MKDRGSYTGIGSRKTPTRIKMRMISIGRRLGRAGFTLRSGRAAGADSAFERGADKGEGFKEIFLPWEGFGAIESDRPSVFVIGEEPMSPGRHNARVRDLVRRATEIAAEIHPAWYSLSENACLLHARNVFQVLGPDLADPSRFLICWTPEGRGQGGTRTAIMVARQHGVPVFDLGSKEWTLRQILKKVIARGR